MIQPHRRGAAGVPAHRRTATVDARLDELTRTAARRLGTVAAFVGIAEEGQLRLKSTYGLPLRRRIPIRKGGRPYLLPDHVVGLIDYGQVPTLTSRLFGGQDMVGLRAFAAAPLRDTDGAVVGSLCVLDHAERPFGEGDRAALAGLANAVNQRCAH